MLCALGWTFTVRDPGFQNRSNSINKHTYYESYMGNYLACVYVPSRVRSFHLIKETLVNLSQAT